MGLRAEIEWIADNTTPVKMRDILPSVTLSVRMYSTYEFYHILRLSERWVVPLIALEIPDWRSALAW